MNIEPKNDGFQKESPIPGAYFQVPCWTWGGHNKTSKVNVLGWEVLNDEIISSAHDEIPFLFCFFQHLKHQIQIQACDVQRLYGKH